MTLAKASVQLGGVELAGNAPVTWRFQSGVTPYTTTVQVHSTDAGDLEALLGEPTVLTILDARGVLLEIKDVYILHRAPTDSHARAAFVIADKRWTWNRRLIAHDFNVPKKTGNRTGYGADVPIQNLVTVDEYDFAPWSIKDDGTRYTAQEALELVLGQLTGDDYEIASFPYDGDPSGQISVQGVHLRDPGDSALNRLLSFIPGARVFVRADGKVVVYDATDTSAVRQYINLLPRTSWSGEVETWIGRGAIRPAQVRVHYQREVELPVEYFDDYAGNTSSAPTRNAPFLECVLPTVDPVTTIVDYDPELGREVEKEVPPGTWVEMSRWLQAMDADRPDGSLPWTFETIKRYWVAGDLDGVLGGRGLDLDEDGNVSLRIQALKQHFRQTFRLNRRYTDRIRSLRAVRTVVLDPVTGARAKAPSWGQACVIPSTKGQRMAARGPDGSGAVFRNVDYLAPSDGGEELIRTSPGPADVQVLDEDLGIFRLQWIVSPYGTEERYIPSKLVDSTGAPRVVTRDLAEQESAPMMAGAEIESGTNGIFLAPQMRMKAILTIVPAAPNDTSQFHRIDVDSTEVAGRFSGSLEIQDGTGPVWDLFITPNEETARFAISSTNDASQSVRELLGLEGDGFDADDDLPGYVLANDGDQGGRHLAEHAIAAAAEVLVTFNDGHQGVMATALPDGADIGLRGNLAATAVRVTQYPSAKVDAVHQLPGQAPPASRFQVLPMSSRVQILGVLPFK